MVSSLAVPAGVALRALAVASACVVSAGMLAACAPAGEGDVTPPRAAAPQSTDFFGYQVSSPLNTTNAASAYGEATSAQLLAGRLYPGAFVPGPGGQLIPNTDLVTAAEVAPTAEGLRQIHYVIAPQVMYSDGVPVTCDDFLLAYTAGSMPRLFGSHQPIINEINHLACGPGAKDFFVILKHDQGDRWKHFFGPGTVMPAHAIARQVGITLEQLVEDLGTWEPERIKAIAEVWRNGFNLRAFSPAVQVAYGPFFIDHVGAAGEVILQRNPHYAGEAAHIGTLVVWPQQADSAALAAAGALRIQDTTGGKPAWVEEVAEPNNYAVSPTVGELTDTLILSNQGLFADVAARQALAACVNQEAMAQVSAQQAQIQVPPVYVHALRHGDPIAKQLADVIAPHRSVDLPKAERLRGATVRVGYLAPDGRLQAMVEQLRKSCAPAGITIVDAGTPTSSAADLYIQPNGLPLIDAYLGPVDPLTEYPTVAAKISQVERLKQAEAKLWEEVPAIPVAAQPRTFIVDKQVENLVPYSGMTGLGWNMDRWSVPGVGQVSSAAKESAS